MDRKSWKISLFRFLLASILLRQRNCIESWCFRAGDRLSRSLINISTLQMTTLRPRGAKWLAPDPNCKAKIKNQVIEISMLFSLFYIILHKLNLRCSGMWFIALKEDSVGHSNGANDISIHATQGERKIAPHSVHIFKGNNKFNITFLWSLSIASMYYSNINTWVLQNYRY